MTKRNTRQRTRAKRRICLLIFLHWNWSEETLRKNCGDRYFDSGLFYRDAQILARNGLIEPTGKQNYRITKKGRNLMRRLTQKGISLHRFRSFYAELFPK